MPRNTSKWTLSRRHVAFCEEFWVAVIPKDLFRLVLRLLLLVHCSLVSCIVIMICSCDSFLVIHRPLHSISS